MLYEVITSFFKQVHSQIWWVLYQPVSEFLSEPGADIRENVKSTTRYITFNALNFIQEFQDEVPTSHRITSYNVCYTKLLRKLHTHGAYEKNMPILLGNDIETMFSYLDEHYNDNKLYSLHYVTAREMYNIIKAAEDGNVGDPGKFKDYCLKSKNKIVNR